MGKRRTGAVLTVSLCLQDSSQNVPVGMWGRGGEGLNVNQKLHLSATLKWLIQYVENYDYCLEVEANGFLRENLDVRFRLFISKFFIAVWSETILFNVALYTGGKMVNESSRTIK
jgi:hypothetical protein